MNGAAIRQIDPNSIYVEEFPLQLTDAEIALNKQISVSIDYGGRRGFLAKTANYALPLEGAGGGAGLQLAAAGIIIVIVLLLAAAVAVYFLFMRKKK